MKFSLILPTYRVAKYITNCLESCCRQSAFPHEEYEIIIVNDETPDDSIEVAQKVIDRFPTHNWKIVNRKNGGLSAARNSGLLNASGDYVWFIDSDDFIQPESLNILNDVIKNGDYDIVNFTHKTIFKNNRINGGDVDFDAYDVTGVNYLKSTNFLSACTCIYKRQFLTENNLRFKEGVIWEDSEFNTRAYLLTSKCRCLCNALYNYVRRENSISDIKATYFSTNSRISNALDLDEYFNSADYSTFELSVAYNSIASMLVAAIAGFPELGIEDRKYFRNVLSAHRKQYWRIFMKCSSLKSRVIMLCYWVVPSYSENLLNRKVHEAINRTLNI